MGERRAVRAAAVLWCTAAVVVLVGCTPESEPTPPPLPTATGFASDAEAFAAAEATYRAYVDALNDVDLAIPSTFDPVYQMLAGDALSNEARSLRAMHDDNWIVTGDSAVVDFFDASSASDLIAIGCLDVRGVKLVDAEGRSQVSSERPSVYAMQLKFSQATNVTGLRITESTAVEDPRCSP